MSDSNPNSSVAAHSQEGESPLPVAKPDESDLLGKFHPGSASKDCFPTSAVGVPGNQNALEQLERLQLAALATSDVIYDWRFDSDSLWWGERTAQFVGELHQPAENWWRGQIHPDDVTRVTTTLKQALSGSGERWYAQYRLRLPDGSYVRVYDTASILREASRPLRMVGSLGFVKRESASENYGLLQGADPLLHDILEFCSAVVYVKDLEGRYFFVNRHYEQLFNTKLADVLGRNDTEIFGPEVGPRLRNNDLAMLASGRPLEIEEVVNHPDGPHTYISTKYPLRDSAGEPYAICGVSTDITDRKKTEELLRESEARYRLLAENSYDMITRNSPNGKYSYVSPASARLLGYEPEELIGSDPFKLLHPDDIEPTLKIQRDILQGTMTNTNIVCRLRHKQGHYVWTDSSMQIVREPATGAVVEAIVSTRDVTERKSAEKAIRHATRLASIGTLAAGIAHEINNPIGAAWTSAEAALAVKDDPNASDLLTDCLQNVIQSVRRCGEIVRNVLRFSRHEALDKGPADLNNAVRQSYDATRTYADAKGASIELRLDPQLPKARLNHLEMEQIITNLMRNAVESGESVSIVVQTSYAEGKACLRVKDTGRGLTEAERDRIWEPFYTLRADQGGTGLGLSIVFGIVQECGGLLRVESEQGEGTTVLVYLPAETELESVPTRK